MGIRYYAYPVPPADCYAAAADPDRFLGSDPLADAWGLVPAGSNLSAFGAKPRPEMLYLDKCWPLLQRLTRPTPEEERPAHYLFAGWVSAWDENGYEPYRRALSPEEVSLIADDLLTMTDEDVDAHYARDDVHGREEDPRYVKHFLAKAKEFAARMQELGWGLVYIIG